MPGLGGVLNRGILLAPYLLLVGSGRQFPDNVLGPGI